MKKLFSLLVFMTPFTLFAQTGNLNTSFDANGIVSLDSIVLLQILQQPDGKFLAIGKTNNGNIPYSSHLFRINANGTLDTAFGDRGIVNHVILPSIALQADGKIVTGGAGGAVMRLHTDGSTDTSFGENGRAAPAPSEYVEFSYYADYAAIGIQSDGKIVVAANPSNGAYFNYVLLRYNRNGSQDFTFGDKGLVFKPDFEKLVRSMQLDGDQIVVVGYREEQGVNSFLIRYKANGQEDWKKVNWNSDIWLRGLQVTGKGEYLLWGRKSNFYCLPCPAFYSYDFFLTDTFTKNFDPDFLVIKILKEKNGNILVAGKTRHTYSLKRYHRDTSIDSSFGYNGTLVLQHPVTDMLLAGDTLCTAGDSSIASYLLNAPAGPITWYRDADGDGWGNPKSTKEAKEQPRGYVSNNLDCNDKNKTKGGPEVCDGRDNDCDGIIDNGLERKPFYSDWDGDGYGSPKRMKLACAAPPRYVSNSEDMNDDNPRVYPGAPELCDGRDNNQNGVIDEGFAKKTFYHDFDKDGYGNPSITLQACAAPLNYVAIAGDCNDRDSSIHPGAVGPPNDGIDNNCNGLIDEPVHNAVTSEGNIVVGEQRETLLLAAQPNPSTQSFTLRIQGVSATPVQLRILDEVGRVVEEKQGLSSNATITLGQTYRPGVYYAEAMQGSEKASIKLVKQTQ